MSTKPIQLTTSGYWQELEKLFEAKELPQALCDALKGLVNSHINKTNPPRATKMEIQQAKLYLKNGIELSSSATNPLFQVVVYVPKKGQEEERISFFKLIPLYPGCDMRRLDEITE